MSSSAEREISAATAQVVLRRNRVQPFLARHPWVLVSAIERIEGTPADGDVVDLIGDRGRWVARGVFNAHSRLRVRLYSWDREAALDAGFWRARLAAAIALRRDLGLLDPDGACRLVFSEADGLSGLIVDRYRSTLVVQINSLAFAQRLEIVLEALRAELSPEAIVVRGDPAAARFEQFAVTDGLAWGSLPPGPLEFRENGLRFEVDPLEGHKTGYYLDQRDNRRAAAGYLSGRRVLDMFCYTGSFALAARSLGGAREVLAYDSSAKALEQARRHAELNQIDGVEFRQGEAFETLDQLSAVGERFGAVILDPPKFAGQRRHVDQALRAYHRLNRLAVELIEPGGFLVTCSCSGHVTREDLLDVLTGVGQQARRSIQVLEQRGAAPDHPVALACPESEYLKCLICRV